MITLIIGWLIGLATGGIWVHAHNLKEIAKHKNNAKRAAELLVKSLQGQLKMAELVEQQQDIMEEARKAIKKLTAQLPVKSPIQLRHEE
jgi:hypothetical protein